MRHAAALILAATLGLPLAGCATVKAKQDLAYNDPLEKFNRGMWGFNRNLDKVVLKPVTGVYRTIAPKPARRGATNFFNNVAEPWSAINALLQGKVGRAFHTLARFAVNTTIGVGGLADNATKLGLAERKEDFGQTMAVWGFSSGPFVMLPFFGPSTLRDGVGTAVASVGDPFNIAQRKVLHFNQVERIGVTALQAIDLRSQLIDTGADSFLDSSVDSYATVRAAYLQRREAQILNRDSGSDSAVDPSDFEGGDTVSAGDIVPAQNNPDPSGSSSVAPQEAGPAGASPPTETVAPVPTPVS